MLIPRLTPSASWESMSFQGAQWIGDQKRKTTQPLSMEVVPPLKVRAALRFPGRKPRTLKPGHFRQTTTLPKLESSRRKA